MFKKLISVVALLIGANAHAACDSNEQNMTNPDVASECFRAGQYSEALRRADAIIDVDKTNALSWRFKGEVLFQMEKYADSINAFERAEEIGGAGTEEIFFWRALAHHNSGDRYKAVEILERYVSENEKQTEMVNKVKSALSKIGASS